MIIVSPEYNTGLFLFTSLIATTKADSKQSTITQLIFQNSIGTSKTELEEEVSQARQARGAPGPRGNPSTCRPLESECCTFLQIFREKIEDWILLFKMHFAFFVCFVMLRCF